MIRLLGLALVLLASAASAETADEILAQAKADCASIDNGVFSSQPAAVVTLDLTGDGQPETIVDTAHFQCTTSASFWGGTAGTWFSVLVAGQRVDYIAHAWQVVTWQDAPVLMMWHNGGDCGGSGADPCVEAVVWSDYQQRFMSVAPALE